jgi:hypothetical protein
MTSAKHAPPVIEQSVLDDLRAREVVAACEPAKRVFRQ